MDITLFASIFVLIFVAELPDKTALATLTMATRGKPQAIFVGVALAFVIQCLVAVSFGRVFAMLPEHWVQFAAGLLFLGFAAHAWFSREEDEESSALAPKPMPAAGSGAGTGASPAIGVAPATREAPAAGAAPVSAPSGFWLAVWSSFVVIFIAEWGDLTQIATASLAAKYPQSLYTVFFASVLALWSVTGLAIAVGHRLKTLIRGDLLRKFSTFLFAAIGIYFVYTGFRYAVPFPETWWFWSRPWSWTEPRPTNSFADLTRIFL